MTRLDRLPPVLWSLNTLVCASTSFISFFLEHGPREPWYIASRAMDTTDIASAKWVVEVMQQRLQLAGKVQPAIDTHAKDDQL